MPDFQAFTGTTYGRILLVKLAVVVPLAGLGAVNHFFIRPRLAGPTLLPGLLTRFIRVLTGELGLAAGVLLAVAVLTVTPPARVVRMLAAQERTTLAGRADDLTVRLTLLPRGAGWHRYEVEARVGQQTRVTDGRVILRFRTLIDDSRAPTAVLRPDSRGRFAAEGGELGSPGWREIEVVVRRRGRLDVSTSFPWVAGTGLETSQPEAERLLKRARQARARLRSWREMEQLSDGNGGVSITRWEIVPPDRLTYRTGAGTTAVIVGADRYTRAGSGPWERDTLVQPLDLSRSYLLEGAREVVSGRMDRCGAEACRVVTWRVGESARFAGWIGLTTHRFYRLLMIAPDHYMTTQVADFNAPIQISAPD